MMNFSNLTTRLLCVLLLVFLVFLAMVYWIIDQQAKPNVAKLTSQTIIETGNEAVNGILSRVSQIDGMAVTASRMTGSLPKNADIINTSVGNLMANMDKGIVGGGVWYDPLMYKPNVDEAAFVWQRDMQGVMQSASQYQTINPGYQAPSKLTANRVDSQKTQPQLAMPYYRDWWYVPAVYANHDHCVWSRAYIHPATKQPVMTCAKAIFNAQNNGFEGVVSFDVLLGRMQSMVKEWQRKTGGYVFLVDMNNNFLTFPNEAQVKQVTASNPQGEMIDVNSFAKKNPDFAPIAKSLDNINDNIIKQAQKIDGGKFDFTANTLVSSTNLQKISPSEARIISAMLMTQSGQNENLNATHFVEQVSLDNDLLLKTPSTAFIFAMPMTNWKMVIVKPNQELMLFANQLGKQLQWYMLLGFLPVLLLSGYIFHRILAVPLHQVARNVREIGQLIAQKKYLSLREHKLPPANIQEIGVITDSMNQLVDRVVENEGALAKVNERLEQQVAERTENLHQALKDLKASQVQLVQSEKMATIGQMVAGVAHEVNTPLGYVGSNLELIDENIVRYDELIDHTQQLKQLMQASPTDTATINQTIEQTIACSDELVADAVSDDLHGLVDDAKFGVSQISELVVNLRDFSRIDQAKIKAVDINDCIKNSLVIARNNIKHLEVITELNAIEPVSCNPSQINQVLLNLFNNAAQAMGQTQHPTLHITSTEDGANVYISVADNGTGMSAETQAKIFEPFFTTKAAGEGTGLGLAISTQIMEQHNGDIHVQSQLGEGTTFTIRLPKTAISSEQSPKLLIAEES